MKNLKLSKCTGAILSALLLSTSHYSIAAEETRGVEERKGLEHIEVSATRRITTIQEVSVAITALSGDELSELGIINPRQLSGLSPSLNVDQGLGNGQTHVSIRGMASTGFGLEDTSPAAIYVDDVFQPFQFGLATSIFDMERIEVLRGPQGTLFGKNTIAGSLNYHTKGPTDENEGYITLGIEGGDADKQSVEGAFNLALTDDLAARASFRYEKRDDYITNLAEGFDDTGEYDSISGRLQFLWTPSDDTSVSLKLFALDYDGDGPEYISTEILVPGEDLCINDITSLAPYSCVEPWMTNEVSPHGTNSRETYSNIDTFEKSNSSGGTLKIEHQMGEYSLTSITNYQKGEVAMAVNDDGILTDFFHSRQASEATQYSQEIRFATDPNQPLNAIFGLFFMHDEINTNQGSISSMNNISIIPDLAYYEYTDISPATTETDSYAAFTSVTYEFSPKFKVIGGLRYTEDTKTAIDYTTLEQFGYPGRDITEDYFDVEYGLAHFDPAFDIYEVFNGKESWSKTTWDIAFDYKPNDYMLLYAKMATGFKSGGLYSAPEGSIDENGDPLYYIPLEPETVESYEFGIKSDWFDNLLRVNAAAFYVDYKDMQIQTANQSGSGLGFSNAAAAVSKGIELEVELLATEDLLLAANFGYVNAEYVNYQTLVDGQPADLSGNALPFAPEITANLTAFYLYPLTENYDLSIINSWSYRSEFFFDAVNDPITSEEARVMGDFSVSLIPMSEEWSVTAYVNNLTNEDIAAFGFNLGIMSPKVYAPQRTYGMKLSYNF